MTPQDWIDDIELIASNTMAYNSIDSPLVDKVMHFRDMAMSMVEYLSAEFVWECKQVAMRRRASHLVDQKKKLIEKRQQDEEKEEEALQIVEEEGSNQEVDSNDGDKPIDDVDMSDADGAAMEEDEIVAATHDDEIVLDSSAGEVTHVLETQMTRNNDPPLVSSPSASSEEIIQSIAVVAIESELAIPSIEPESLEELQHELFVDKYRLGRLIDALVRVTDKFSVSQLEELAVVLSGIIEKSKDLWDRNVIIEEIEKILPQLIVLFEEEFDDD